MHRLDSDTYRLLLEDTLTGYWEYNLETRSVSVSTTFKQVLGYDEEELSDVGKVWKQIIHEDDQESLVTAYQNLVASRGETTFKLALRYHHKNGSIIWMMTRGRAFRWNGKGEVSCMIGSLRDITAQKEYERQLKTSESRFKDSFNSSAIGMALVGIDGHWLEVNDTMCKIVGYSKAELKEMTFQDLTHPDDLKADLRNVELLLQGRIPFYQLEKRYVHRSGEVVWILLSVSLVRDADAEPLHFVSQIEDVTTRKVAEEELKNSLAVVSKQNERLLNFAHIVSHNLRSHAANMEMMLGLAKNEDDPREQTFLMSSMQDINSSFKSTLDHLTEVVLIQLDRDLATEPLSLRRYIDKTLDIVAGELRAEGGQAEVLVDSGMLVQFYPAYLDSILLNLISNAIKYRHPERPPLIRISASYYDHGYIALSIADNGLGIDLQKHGHKLFGMYKTFHKNKNSRGIGLFITKNQVEALGGRIEVTSKPDNGSTFTLYLPYEKI